MTNLFKSQGINKSELSDTLIANIGEETVGDRFVTGDDDMPF